MQTHTHTDKNRTTALVYDFFFKGKVGLLVVVKMPNTFKIYIGEFFVTGTLIKITIIVILY